MKTRNRYFVSDLVAEVGSLPNLAARVVSLTADPECDMGTLARLILSDNVLTMRFLALANSAAFSRGQETRDLQGALVRLGLRRVRNVALLMGIHDMTTHDNKAHHFDPDAYWLHSLAVACCAQGLTQSHDRNKRDDAWLVGILHGLGLSLLSQHNSEGLDQTLSHARRAGIPLADAEMTVLGFHHGEVGARILRAWNLPGEIADVVEFHPEEFDSSEVPAATAEVIGVLRRAIALARAIGYGDCGDGDPAPCLADLTEELGWSDQELARLAADVDQQVRDLAGLIGFDRTDSLFSQALDAARAEVARLGLAGLDEGLIKEELEAQLDAAREIQNHILPRTSPTIVDCALAATNIPSRHVSGDTYDFFPMPDGGQGIAIADVAGKGMPAALLASTLQASLRALAQVIDDPGELLTAANRALYASTDDERFATTFVAVVDADGRRLRYANAGHNPPLLQRADKNQEWLSPAGPPLGMMPESTYPVGETCLNPGDLLVAYTDGVTEAPNAQGTEFSRQRLSDAVAQATPCSPDDLVGILIAAVSNHLTAETETGTGPDGATAISPAAADDLTMVVLQRLA